MSYVQIHMTDTRSARLVVALGVFRSKQKGPWFNAPMIYQIYAVGLQNNKYLNSLSLKVDESVCKIDLLLYN